MKNGLVIQAPNDRLWYKNNKLHRINGPAIERENGYQAYYINGKCHRIDGPAITYASGRSLWFYDNIWYKEKKYHPFHLFRKQWKISENYDEWSKDHKILFKLTYGGNV